MTLASDIAQIAADTVIFHDVVNGDASETVMTESGAVDTLAAAISKIGAVNYRGDWAALTAYAIGDSVAWSGALYRCIIAHTSGNNVVLGPTQDAADWVVQNAQPANVTNAQMADMAQATLKGRAAGAGTGKPEDLTSAQAAAIIAPSLLTGYKNLLINARGTINQRGYVSGTATGGANQYTLDRWRVVTSGQSLAFTASGNTMEITAPAGGVEQVIEGEAIADGSHVINWSGTATCTVNGTARAKGEAFTLTGGSNCTVRFSGGTFKNPQLEYGAAATPFEQRPIGIEEMLCARFLPAFIAAGAEDDLGLAWAVSATSAAIVVPLGIARVPPTGISISSAGHFDYKDISATRTASAVTFGSASRYFARVTLTVSGATAGNSGRVVMNNASGKLLFTGCEL